MCTCVGSKKISKNKEESPNEWKRCGGNIPWGSSVCIGPRTCNCPMYLICFQWSRDRWISLATRLRMSNGSEIQKTMTCGHLTEGRKVHSKFWDRGKETRVCLEVLPYRVPSVRKKTCQNKWQSHMISSYLRNISFGVNHLWHITSLNHCPDIWANTTLNCNLSGL